MRFLNLDQHCIPIMNILYICQEEEDAEEEGVPVIYVTTHIHLKNGEVIEVQDDFRKVSQLLNI